MTSYAICILAGGEASRFPGKLERMLDGKPLLARVYENVRGPYPAYISARATFPQALDAHLDCPVIIDSRPGRGPLGGLVDAFAALREERVFAIAGDMPNVDCDTLQTLRDAWQPGDAAVVATHDGRPEPLAALYDRRKFLDAAWDVLASTAAVADVARALRARFVPLSQHVLHNINTPADIEVPT